VLLGAYRLHEYSATMWLILVERYSRFANSITLPEDLGNLVRLFIEKRRSGEFNNGAASPPTQTTNQHLFKFDCPDIHEVLRNAMYFQQMCSEREYDKRKGEKTLENLDPHYASISDKQRNFMDHPRPFNHITNIHTPISGI